MNADIELSSDCMKELFDNLRLNEKFKEPLTMTYEQAYKE